MTELDAALSHVRSHHDVYLEQLKSLVAIPSVSTLSEHKKDMVRTAEWLRTQLKHVGMTRAELMPTPLHPMVYAEWLGAPGKPTVLVYGHYDVQPADPLDQWETPPFEPAVRGDYLFARGASDMKGQIFAQLKAVEALSMHGGLPLNLKYLLEGEEEIGSPSLEAFIEKNRDLLECDFVLNCDSGILAPELPSLVYALRGLAYFELEIRGPGKDLHSGLFGGSVHNPGQVLCDLVAGMHDEKGRVTLPGFYDSVVPLDQEERLQIARWPITDDEWKAMTGARELWGEEGYTTLERVGGRPTLEVNGLVSGFTGEGAKTILPAKALAKLSCRLVANQEPASIKAMLEQYLAGKAPKTVSWEMRELSHGPGALMNRDSEAMKAAVKALRTVFAAEPVFRREGGSIPVVGVLKQMLGVESVLLGFGLPEDGIHGPNEKQHLPTLFKGIEAYLHFLASF
ncbi:MAG TPA: dipeptidase [Candidatus Hydrogenedentes bacterium]|nr:dipeptidase [Candidatus Hydrogenedentota bacterium]HQE83557.1 dipeptidase [Candidatus Hydrogenedentota bacterium]HQH52960.1 dipeptidase [Candidatus Hydrogenedentota bacterium]HQM50432.1 dipeptidase [Candidatus Hydrogenedentota bacterium]